MKIKLSSKITQEIPGLGYHILLINHLNNSKRISSINQLLRGTCVVVKNELKKDAKKQLLQNLLEKGKFGEEMLLETYLLNSKIKKIQSGKDLDSADNLSNILSYLSIKHLWPIYAIDLDQLEKDFLIKFYLPKKGKKTPEPEFGKDTRIIALLMPNLEGLKEEEFNRVIEEIDQTIQKYCQGEIAKVFTVNSENPGIDLGYTSEKELEFQKSVQEMEDTAEKTKTSGEPAGQPSEELLNKVLAENSFKEQLKMQVVDAITRLIQKNEQPISLEEGQKIEQMVELEVPSDQNHGDYSTNAALKLTKMFKKNPQELAKKIKEEINASEYLEEIEILAPGFINFKLNKAYLEKQLSKILEYQELFGRIDLGHKQKVMIDFGGLNIAKPFGAHHFPTTVIGQTILNLYQAANFTTIAVDFPGDWGTQFGKMIYAFKNWGDRDVVEKDPMKEFLKLYVRFHEEAETDTSLEDKARAEFKKLEDHDQENYQLWKWISEVSFKDIEKVYKTLGVKHNKRYPESKYLESSISIIKEGKEKGIFTEGENGAIIANLEAEGLGIVPVQKSDGTTLYISRDLASIRDRKQEVPDVKKIIYVVDSAQTLHFKQLFSIAKKFNLTNAELLHIAYGRISFADGAMSTRKGNVIFATDVIEEALKRSEKIINEKSTELPESERKQIAYGMAIGAIKYSMINHSPETDFVFEWEKILNFEGDSAPYLQYSYARARSILRKAEVEMSKEHPPQTDLFSITEEQKALEEDAIQPFEKSAEQKLLRLLIKLPEKLESAVLGNKPNIITSYLIEISQAFNTFYGSVPVIKTQRKDLLEARIKLVQATTQVLKNGLNMLGIAVFERM
jgi:arginyl-tRNA synthetase